MINRKSKIENRKWRQPVDRLALALMLVLSVVIGLVVWGGDACGTNCFFVTGPRVRDFNWQGEKVGVEDTSFILTFSRPMEHSSVEANLRIAPPLRGKFSWAGRKMSYTLTSPASYDTDYKVELQGARERLGTQGKTGRAIQPFTSQFRTRDRAFIYLGVEKEEQGQLILYNLTQNKKTVLTPKDLVVMDFKVYPDGDKVLFSATDSTTNKPGVSAQQLYTVTTGLNYKTKGKSDKDLDPSGRMNLVLDNENYQNLKFDLAADGQTIVVQRVNSQNPAEFGLWVLRPNAPPQPLNNQPGGDFLIAPDSASVASAQGEGIAILPLTPGAKPLDFLPKFGMALDFARDGSAAAMVKFNTDYTRSLFLVTNQGVQKELVRTNGSILNCQFAPYKETLYCLLTQLLPGEEYQEQPYIAAIDLQTQAGTLDAKAIEPLLLLPTQRDIQMSLAPDGLALLFDQVVTNETPTTADSLRTSEGQAIATSRLWLLPLSQPKAGEPPAQLQPEPLPFAGFHPHWIP